MASHKVSTEPSVASSRSCTPRAYASIPGKREYSSRISALSVDFEQVHIVSRRRVSSSGSVTGAACVDGSNTRRDPPPPSFPLKQNSWVLDPADQGETCHPTTLLQQDCLCSSLTSKSLSFGEGANSLPGASSRDRAAQGYSPQQSNSRAYRLSPKRSRSTSTSTGASNRPHTTAATKPTHSRLVKQPQSFRVVSTRVAKSGKTSFGEERVPGDGCEREQWQDEDELQEDPDVLSDLDQEESEEEDEEDEDEDVVFLTDSCDGGGPVRGGAEGRGVLLRKTSSSDSSGVWSDASSHHHSRGGILKLSSDVLHQHGKTVRFASDATLALSPPKAEDSGDTMGEKVRRRARSVPDLSSCMSPRLQPLGASVGVDTVSSESPSCALTESLFPGLPATIHFPLADEEYECLPEEKRALLKWKMSSITPNVVRSCLTRVGFAKLKKGTHWLGYWGKHMKGEAFKGLREYQKVNHFPGSFAIGRKDRLWRSLVHMQSLYGKKEFDFVPQTFVLPSDLRLLKREWEAGGHLNKWIIKPPAAARGIGVHVIHKWAQLPRKKAVVVQRYIGTPFLINGSKFDLRVYVYVSSYDPLRVYISREGLARFCTSKYSSSTKSLSNRFAHLTNYSVNKKNKEFTPNTDETVCQGHKWGLLAFWEYMRTELHLDTDPIWESIKDLVIKTIISAEAAVVSSMKANVRNRWSCHELFGFDVMLDSDLKPWVLEVNISPSLHSNSQLDINIKGQLVRDILNLAGFTLPTKESGGDIRSSGTGLRPLSYEEKTKHAHFVQRSGQSASPVYCYDILDNLTCDDLQVLMETEDEARRCGELVRIFPSPSSHKYLKFFEVQRYYNLLVNAWTRKYHKQRSKGISLLREHQLRSLRGVTRP